MVPVWARDVARDPADLVGQALGLAVRDKDRDSDLPEVVRADLAKQNRVAEVRTGSGSDRVYSARLHPTRSLPLTVLTSRSSCGLFSPDQIGRNSGEHDQISNA
jgi:hypothetical protein